MTQSAALFETHVMITGFLAAVGVGIGAWAAIRLVRAHVQVRHDPALDDLTLCAEAEAVLTARLARGEIDRTAYARALRQLEGLPASDADATPGAIGAAADRAPAG